MKFGKNFFSKGFTLVELLVVIAILAVLAVAVVVVLNPAELLKQARDSTRLADLGALNKATALYFADVAPSSMTATTTCTFATGATTTFPGGGTTPCTRNSSTVATGAGWININFSSISGGSPLSNLPLDPTNDATFFYAFKGSTTVGAYEINAKMESIKYATTSATEVVSATKDGGDTATWYEVGSSLAQTW